MGASESGGGGWYLVVGSGGRRFAIPVTAVRRVVDGMEVHPFRGAGGSPVGLARFAGEPLGVTGLPGGTEPPATPARCTVVVLRYRSRLLGVVVDAVEHLADAGGSGGSWTVLDPDAILETTGGDDATRR